MIVPQLTCSYPLDFFDLALWLVSYVSSSSHPLACEFPEVMAWLSLVFLKAPSRVICTQWLINCSVSPLKEKTQSKHVSCPSPSMLAY